MKQSHFISAEFKFINITRLSVNIRIFVASKSNLYTEGSILIIHLIRSSGTLKVAAVVREINLYKPMDEPERLEIVAEINVRSPFSIRIEQEIPKEEDRDDYGSMLKYRVHESAVNEAQCKEIIKSFRKVSKDKDHEMLKKAIWEGT